MRQLRSDEGVTLIELLTVTVLMGMVLALAYFMLDTVSTMADNLQARTTATDDTRAILDQVTRELRQGVEVSDGKGAFQRAQPRWCAFYADLDHNGVPELIEYRVIGQTLYRYSTTSTTVVPPYSYPSTPNTTKQIATSLNGGWTGNVFTYYDGSNPPGEVSSGHADQVSAVRLELINGATVNKKSVFVDLSTWVRIRSVNNTID